jgi:murein DD-endopeptidase MepM/ murein hydrolase activator NlpD/pSer/pThr/pTyr-binding forkhead associated (FHA) protein
MTPAGYNLHIKIPGRKTLVVTLESFPLTLGRAPVNEIVLDHNSVSRRHARLHLDGGKFYVEDLISSSGTLVKKKQIEPGKLFPIRNKDAIRLGDVTVSIRRQETRFDRQKRVILLAAVAFLAFLAFLSAGGLLIMRGVLNSSEKAAIAVCDSPPMPLIRREGVSIQTHAGSPTVLTPETRPPPTSGIALVVPTAGPGTPTQSPSQILPTAPASRPIVSISFLELPFPYDGGNESFGGTLEQFKQASQLSYLGGRINSYFDHLLPLYPSSKDPAVPGGQEPAEPPIGDNILLFDGSFGSNINYSGHPAYDYSTFVRRQPSTPLFAAADGVVHRVGLHGASGALFVKIVHKVPDVGNFLTIYWHLHPDEYYDAMVGREGQPITAGTRIGTMGNTGYSTGHHLHFEVRFDRNADGNFAASEVVDPYGYIPNSSYPNDPWAARNAPASNYLWVHPLGVAAEVPESGGGSLDPGADTGGIGGTGIDSVLCAPPNSLPPGGTVYWTWAPDPMPEPNLSGTNHACVLSVFDADGNPVTAFDPPLTISIPFTNQDIANVDPESLFIHLLPPGETNWITLPTQLDLENGIATALADQAGKCALLGEPLTDFIPPTTNIEFSGSSTSIGEWYEAVTVTLSATDPSGIALIEYSLDGGTLWQTYSGPFEVQPAGIPDPIGFMDEEFFAGGPGRFLILASATDGLGNIEDPPAFRSLVIDPSKKPEAASIVNGNPPATPTNTPTSTPSLTPPGSEFACAETLEILENAFCRSGPGTIYDALTAFTPGITLVVDGQNADSTVKWWWVQIPNSSSHCWVSDSTVEIAGTTSPACLKLIADPPTPTPPPSETPTPAGLPADTQPPPAPSALTPGGGTSQACTSTVTLSWGQVTDPSGIQQYEWALESSTSGGEGLWFLADSGQTTGTSVSSTISCGIWYRWRVRAIDGVGNIGPYAPYAYFSVVIN